MAWISGILAVGKELGQDLNLGLQDSKPNKVRSMGYWPPANEKRCTVYLRIRNLCLLFQSPEMSFLLFGDPSKAPLLANLPGQISAASLTLSPRLTGHLNSD